MDSSNSRQELVRAAVTFLHNPKLVDSPLQDKLKFLRGKGLTDIEVDEALNSALINRQQPQNGRWNFLLMLGLCLGAYKLYREYLTSRENYMKQKEEAELKAKKETERLAQENRKKEDEPKLKELIEKVDELRKLVEYQKTSLGRDIAGVRALLIGHEKFVVPPQLPSWQLEEEVKESK